MRIQFVGGMAELLGTFRVMLSRFPALRAMDVNQHMWDEARLVLRRN